MSQTSAARARAAEAQRQFVEAQRSYDRWEQRLEVTEHSHTALDVASKLDAVTSELDAKRGEPVGAGGG